MKILAVDDEKDILHLIKRALSGQYQVDTVLFPIESIPVDLAEYSLIIMDVMMPGENGYTIVEKIRDKVDCPILFLSAKALEEDVIYGLSIGADDYIRKPFSVPELRARIDAHIRRQARKTKHLLGDSCVVLNMDECQLLIHDEPVPLTKSEYDIVLLFMRNKGQVFSKSQIYDAIYGYEKEGDESAIPEHIKNIRKKLQEKGIEPIETVWGIGYKWKKEI